MKQERPCYNGGTIGDRDSYRLYEPEMDDEEYESYQAAWHKEFPCCCEGHCHCQGPPPRRPQQVRILVQLPDEPPRLTPAAARALLQILIKAAGQQTVPEDDPAR